ncbi:MAG: tetraacyldisaccharide 4'-kinase [Afipia sp.]|nr:tetraacyldisaccharide 4'-kinase [Afipia sp.]
MREPGFWYRPPSLTSHLLSPLGTIYGALTSQRMSHVGRSVGIPVICIGNYHLGGAGKTPLALKLADLLEFSGEVPFVVSRGYGGQLKGPLRVDSNVHTAAEVGDEPLMMAAHVPVIVSRDRVAGTELAKSQGARIVLLDDGFQNPSLQKDLSLIVVDAKRGVGNGCVFPAGPLRAPLSPQIAKSDALIVIGGGSGADGLTAAVKRAGKLVVRAALTSDPSSIAALRDKRVLAFAGIGDPMRFFETLRANGIDVAEEISFADHHEFAFSEMEALATRATAKSLTLVTTEKDMARIRSDSRLVSFARDISTLAVELEFENEEELRSFIQERLVRARQK